MGSAVVITIQVVALVAISKVGYSLASALSLAIPGNLLGMLLLLGLLATGMVRVRWLETSASLLLRHLAFFFVPITVGLMGFVALLARDAVPILVTLVVSAGIGLCAAGLTSQVLASRRRRDSA
jgi:holin-like protein